MPNEGTRRWRSAAIIEIAALSVILLSYIWGWQHAFAGASQLIFVLYFGLILLSQFRRRESLREVGVRGDNLARAVRNAAVIVVPASALCVLIGWSLDSLHFPTASHTGVLALWLIVWGTAQQFGLSCFFYRRFREIFANTWAATAGASLMFAVFHVPNGFLVAVTLAAGVAACRLYEREPNLFALGLAHAMISLIVLYSLPYGVTHGLRVGPGYYLTIRS
jgi:membrane protease YdiL (CAAX protease family)